MSLDGNLALNIVSFNQCDFNHIHLFVLSAVGSRLHFVFTREYKRGDPGGVLRAKVPCRSAKVEKRSQRNDRSSST
jgi:hypothetical protein